MVIVTAVENTKVTTRENSFFCIATERLDVSFTPAFSSIGLRFDFLANDVSQLAFHPNFLDAERKPMHLRLFTPTTAHTRD